MITITLVLLKSELIVLLSLANKLNGMSDWYRLPCNRTELQLLPVLLGGQSFRWKSDKEDEYLGVFAEAVWQLKQTDDCIFYKSRGLGKEKSEVHSKKILKNYLRLDENLDSLYSQWSLQDKYFRESSEKFYGIRMLRQNVFENVFSFICSSNNNIARISSMVEKLCYLYGPVITTVDGKEYHSFPEVKALSEEGVEEQLREAGFGYRAKFIHKAACKILEAEPSSWLKNLAGLPYSEAKVELMKLPGIGAKVADCICLMSLNHLNAVPVDTHVFQIACKRYLPHLAGKKSVTDRVYNEVADHFRAIFGDYAGWAHTVLFCADLKSFQKKEKKGVKRKQSAAV